MFNIIMNISIYELLINELVFLELFINKFFFIPTTLFPVWSRIVIRVVEGGIGIGVLHLTIADFLRR
jgi:hypothetical protein